jgi:hypothetical protein
MALSNLLIGFAIFCALWGVVSMILIAEALRKRNMKVNWIFLKVLIIKYVGQYRKITLQETGKVGPLYYSFVVSMNLALVTGIIGIVFRNM